MHFCNDSQLYKLQFRLIALKLSKAVRNIHIILNWGNMPVHLHRMREVISYRNDDTNYRQVYLDLQIENRHCLLVRRFLKILVSINKGKLIIIKQCCIFYLCVNKLVHVFVYLDVSCNCIKSGYNQVLYRTFGYVNVYIVPNAQ